MFATIETPLIQIQKLSENWFTTRVVDEWNKLNVHVVNADTTGQLKKKTR